MNTGLLIGMGVGIGVLLLLSALFSFSEMALASVNKIKLKSESEKKGLRGKRASRALKFVNMYNETVTAIVIMNNIVNILGTTLATVFFGGLFANNPATGAIVSFVVMTLATISIGEVTPKMLAKKHNLNGVIYLSMVLQIVVWVFYPVTWVINKIAKNEEEVMLESDEDIKAALKETASAGHIDADERELLTNALELDNTSLSKIMIRAEEVQTLYKNTNSKVVENIIIDSGFTRFPVIDSEDNVVGIYNTKFFIKDALSGKKFKLDRSIYDTTFFTKDIKLDDALAILRKNRQHMAVIVESKNSKKMIGIVTIEDIVEEIVGELYDETDREVNGIMAVEDNHFFIHWDANALDVLKEVFSIKKPKVKATVKFSDWVKTTFKVTELKEGQHFTYKDSIIWIKKDKATSRVSLSFEIDLIK